MNIVTRDKLCKCENGTVFMVYQPEITDGEIHIITGASENINGWNGELLLTPFWECDSKCSERFSQWMTTDAASHDYDAEQKFMIFSKTEVQQMINALVWAISGCTTYFNQDIWICGDTVISDHDMKD